MREHTGGTALGSVERPGVQFVSFVDAPSDLPRTMLGANHALSWPHLQLVYVCASQQWASGWRPSQRRRPTLCQAGTAALSSRPSHNLSRKLRGAKGVEMPKRSKRHGTLPDVGASSAPGCHKQSPWNACKCRRLPRLREREVPTPKARRPQPFMRRRCSAGATAFAATFGRFAQAAPRKTRIGAMRLSSDGDQALHLTRNMEPLHGYLPWEVRTVADMPSSGGIVESAFLGRCLCTEP